MSLTLVQLRLQVTHALAGGSLASQLVTDTVINEAGKFLFSSHQWAFRERPPARVSVVGGQEYTRLPVDLEGILAIETTSGYSLIETTVAELAAMRSQTGLTAGGSSYFAVVRDTIKPDRVRMELWPTPSDDDLSYGTVWYRAGWVDLVLDTDVASIPAFAETLLILFVREFARGYEEDDLQDRLDKIVSGTIYAAAKREDGLVQSNYGPVVGGAAMVYGATDPLWNFGANMARPA